MEDKNMLKDIDFNRKHLRGNREIGWIGEITWEADTLKEGVVLKCCLHEKNPAIINILNHAT